MMYDEQLLDLDREHLELACETVMQQEGSILAHTHPLTAPVTDAMASLARLQTGFVEVRTFELVGQHVLGHDRAASLLLSACKSR
jgi:hypothetical protein